VHEGDWLTIVTGGRATIISIRTPTAPQEWHAPESDGLWSSSRRLRRDWWYEALGRKPLYAESAARSGSRRLDA